MDDNDNFIRLLKATETNLTNQIAALSTLIVQRIDLMSKEHDLYRLATDKRLYDLEADVEELKEVKDIQDGAEKVRRTLREFIFASIGGAVALITAFFTGHVR